MGKLGFSARMYIIWDPGSHEHLAHYNEKRPGRAKFNFLDSDMFHTREVHVFHTIAEARAAAKAIMKATVDEFVQLSIREVELALAEKTGKYISRVDNPRYSG